jgi:hypothetical protein
VLVQLQRTLVLGKRVVLILLIRIKEGRYQFCNQVRHPDYLHLQCLDLGGLILALPTEVFAVLPRTR